MKKIALFVVAVLTIATIGYSQSAPLAKVISVFGRTGAVVAQSGDYSVGDVTGAAPTASPAFTGTPTAPTPTAGDNSNALATTAFVQNALPQAPIRVANLSFLSQTAGLPPTTIYTPTVNGNFRVSMYAHASGGIYFTLGWTDESGAVGICTNGTVFDTCNLVNNEGYVAGWRDVVIHAQSGDPIVLSTNGTGTSSYDIYVVVEQI